VCAAAGYRVERASSARWTATAARKALSAGDGAGPAAAVATAKPPAAGAALAAERLKNCDGALVRAVSQGVAAA
jgi:hypothetical protein